LESRIFSDPPEGPETGHHHDYVWDGLPRTHDLTNYESPGDDDVE
jgi:hypothetical protein